MEKERSVQLGSSYRAPMFKNERTTLERLEKFLSEQQFLDCNLRGRLYGESLPVYQIRHHSFGQHIVTFTEATQALSAVDCTEVGVGFKFGPTWSTHWFQIDVVVPEKWQSKKRVVLRVDAECEATLWSADGQVIQGLSPDFGRTDFELYGSLSIPLKFYVEASCSDRGGDGDGYGIRPAKMDKQFQLKRCEIAEYNHLIHELIIDFEILLDMARMLPKEGIRHYQALYTANDMLVWVKEHYPNLYHDMRDYAMENRFVGVGGAWVEMDGNLPSGESIIRQLLYGQREFMNFCGKYSNIFWLPDTFGYSAQLPQIMKHCGMDYFVTQKMSWNIRNKFPHNSFHWFGIDGTRVLAHFPPHSYVTQITVKECLESQSNFTDRGRSNVAMMLYGFGDGGGGPEENMLKRAARLEDCDGVPRVRHATPEAFFAEVTLHFIVSFTLFYSGLLEKVALTSYFQSMSLLEFNEGKSLRNQWHRFLLNQFHDILPGSGLKEVVADAMKIYSALLNELTADGDKNLKWEGLLCVRSCFFLFQFVGPSKATSLYPTPSLPPPLFSSKKTSMYTMNRTPTVIT
ncbi:unnamed protein product [Gongylonema pulchrum]|uniref:Alpha-mannosidase n=1 Tax=Gongylonema pulchrum TaxID=637853 RepID=A0A183DS63_9BILA|nr:unnamed protein product [Gongylonema pulchrum]